jgi:hypothetical protein
MQLNRILQTDNRNKKICAFCDSVISKGKSICDECMKNHGIRLYDIHNDGRAALNRLQYILHPSSHFEINTKPLSIFKNMILLS